MLPSINDIRNSFEQFKSAWQAEGRLLTGAGKPRLIASFWYGIDAKGKEQMMKHLERYMNFMPKEIASQLIPHAGFSGSISDLKDFLQEIKKLGADDVILAPTCTNLDEINAIAKVIF